MFLLVAVTAGLIRALLAGAFWALCKSRTTTGPPPSWHCQRRSIN